MGDPKKTKKHYQRPKRLWDKENLELEKAIKETFGLKNKRELWRINTMLSKKRKSARQLLALQADERAKREQILVKSLARLGLLDEKAGLDDILTLSTEAVLERRLQTIVWRKGLANTTSQARQFITHGHIAINGRKVSAPGHIVTAEEEKNLGYFGKKMELKPKEQEKPKPKENAEATEPQTKAAPEAVAKAPKETAVPEEKPSKETPVETPKQETPAAEPAAEEKKENAEEKKEKTGEEK